MSFYFGCSEVSFPDLNLKIHAKLFYEQSSNVGSRKKTLKKLFKNLLNTTKLKTKSSTVRKLSNEFLHQNGFLEFQTSDRFFHWLVMHNWPIFLLTILETASSFSSFSHEGNLKIIIIILYRPLHVQLSLNIFQT